MVKYDISSFQGWKFGLVALACEMMFIFVLGFKSEYDLSANALKSQSSSLLVEANITANPSIHMYPFFQDVQGMMFLGFGFLMTFLKLYGFSAIAYNFFICGFGLQWALIMNGVRHLHNGLIQLDVVSLIGAEFNIAAILISLGAVLGKVSLLQLTLMTLAEMPLIAWNEYVGDEILRVSDVGDSMYVHMFGAYFGLAVSAVLARPGSSEYEKEGSVYHSDLFSMIGTLILWIFWPSFNAGVGKGDGQARAVVNTFLGLCASVVMTFVIAAIITEPSKEIDPKTGDRVQRFTGRQMMVYVQNATLAGGVALGTSADMMIGPHGALVIGSIAGIISTLGYRYITPNFNKYIHDTCGVNNLHGMPGLLGGFAGSVSAALATVEVYGTSLYLIFPAMAPTDPFTVNNIYYGTNSVTGGVGRSRHFQGAYQLASMACTLAIAIVGGLVTGLLLRFIPWLDQPSFDDAFDDNLGWEVPEGGIDLESGAEKVSTIRVGLISEDNKSCEICSEHRLVRCPDKGTDN